MVIFGLMFSFALFLQQVLKEGSLQIFQELQEAAAFK